MPVLSPSLPARGSEPELPAEPDRSEPSVPSCTPPTRAATSSATSASLRSGSRSWPRWRRAVGRRRPARRVPLRSLVHVADLPEQRALLYLRSRRLLQPPALLPRRRRPPLAAGRELALGRRGRARLRLVPGSARLGL